jgi:glycosyltransferase involved in cell wall biosynthesis
LQQHDFKIVHCRGYISAIMGEWLKKRTGARFIFDMRGWWPDEKKEAGDWASSFYKPVYNYFKKRERNFFRKSDLSISLTHAGKEHIISHGLKEADRVDVIPTCVNFNVFLPFSQVTRNDIRAKLNLPQQATVMIYSGSLGGNYRTDLMLKFFGYLLKQRPGSFFLFLTHSSAGLVKMEIEKSGIAPDCFRQVHATYSEVSQYLMAGDIGLVMYNDGFSVIGRSPTKLGEYWASGLKALSAKCIGDLDYLIKLYPKGGALSETIDKEEDLETAATRVFDIDVSKEELREFAIDYFDLEKGCRKYLENYRKLMRS